MASDEDSWVAFTSLGGALLVVGLFLLDDAVWYVQYAVLTGAVLLSLAGAYRAVEESDAL